MTGRHKNTFDKFWDRVDRKGPDECWPYKGSLRNGYGHHSMNYRSVYAHRVAWQIANGEAPPSGKAFHVTHTCNNKACCNPEHLILDTASENTRAAYRDGLALSGERHPRAKLTDEQVAAIRADTRPQVEIAKAFGIRQPHVSSIKRGAARKDRTNAA